MEERVHRLLFLRALNYNLSVSVSLLIPLCVAPLVVGTGNFVFLVAEMDYAAREAQARTARK